MPVQPRPEAPQAAGPARSSAVDAALHRARGSRDGRRRLRKGARAGRTAPAVRSSGQRRRPRRTISAARAARDAVRPSEALAWLRAFPGHPLAGAALATLAVVVDRHVRATASSHARKAPGLSELVERLVHPDEDFLRQVLRLVDLETKRYASRTRSERVVRPVPSMRFVSGRTAEPGRLPLRSTHLQRTEGTPTGSSSSPSPWRPSPDGRVARSASSPALTERRVACSRIGAGRSV